MNGIHDMGGMQDMGPIHPEQNELVFHAPWERRVFALFNAVDFTWPVLRSELELIAPADYLRMSYFEKWLTALGPLLIKAGMVTPAEIDAGKPIGRSTNKWHVVSAAEVATWIAPDSGTNDKPSAAARFQAAQRVRARNMNPIGHTRLPRYARGKTGTIARVRGADVFPDAVVQGLGKKLEYVYTVRFTAQELWGAPASRIDSVYADLWEDYLEPA